MMASQQQLNFANQSTNVYEFLVFSKSGSCLYHADFTGTINFEKEKDKSSDVYQRQKLIFGLVWSLKSFSQMVFINFFRHSRLAIHETIAMFP